MAHPDPFALQRSDLNAFLFAEVGTERNGMTLTIMSVLARLGEDPWEKARRLAAQQKASATNDLAQIIAQIPASPWSFTEATTVAARLILLLPSNPVVSQPPTELLTPTFAGAGWMGTALLYGALGAFLMLNALVQSAHVADRSTVAPKAAHELQMPKAPESLMPAGISGGTVDD